MAPFSFLSNLLIWNIYSCISIIYTVDGSLVSLKQIPGIKKNTTYINASFLPVCANQATEFVGNYLAS